MNAPMRPVLRQPAPPALAARFFAALALIAVAAIGMMGAAGFRELTAAQKIAMLALFVSGAALLSWSLAWQMTPGSLHRVAPKAAIFGVLGAILVGFAAFFPRFLPLPGLSLGWPCLSAGLLVALPAFAALWYPSRRAGEFSGRTLGATLGAAAGLLGAAVLQFNCRRPDASHLIVWHGGVLVASTALGSGLAWILSFVRRY